MGSIPPDNLELRPGHYPGFLTVAYPLNPFEAVANNRGEPVLVQRIAQKVEIAWVDPRGPLEGVAQAGETIEAVDGRSLLSEQILYYGWIGPRTLTLRQQNATRDVVIAPEEWPFDLEVAVVVQDAPLMVSLNLRQQQLLQPLGLSARIVEPGTILLLTSTGFLDRIDDDELSWALAHELAHVVLGHLTRKPTVTERVGSLLSAVMSPILLVPIAGAVVTATVTETAAGIHRRSNRDQERDADRAGTQIACAAGIDAAAGPRLMETLSKGPQASVLRQFFDEHPSYDEREELIRSTAAAECR
jgi:Zn-dependent protease with chaperone function